MDQKCNLIDKNNKNEVSAAYIVMFFRKETMISCNIWDNESSPGCHVLRGSLIIWTHMGFGKDVSDLKVKETVKKKTEWRLICFLYVTYIKGSHMERAVGL